MLHLNFLPFPQLTTNRLVLRQLIAADATAISALRSNATVNQYLNRPKTTTLAEAIVFIDKITTAINNNQSLYWVIASKESNQLMGTICLWNIVAEEDTAEIGYELHPDFQGKGIMLEALKAVIDFAFNTIQLKVITAFAVAENIASLKSLERSGFELDVSGKYAGQSDEGCVIYVRKK